MTTIILIVLALIAVAVIFDTKPGAFLKGLYGSLFEDMAQTPEGAKALYQKAQEEAQSRYTKAKSTLELVAGQCSAAKGRLSNATTDLTKCEKICENLAQQAGKDEELRLYVSKRMELLATIDFEKAAVAKLEPAQAQAQKIVDALGDQCRKLEREKTQRISELQMSKNMRQVYASMDELAADSEIDKLLKATKDGAAQAMERAEGAKIVHENSLDAKLKKASDVNAQLEADAYIASLKKK